ncbi:MAG: hypothetical protein KA436_10625 [Oligoflexales bacterium]|nr:hypothetical protein [Oligoflexales bacterium]
MSASRIEALQVGMIPFWNLLPFRMELLKQTSSSNSGGFFEIKQGPPTSVNRWLQEGQIHLAPCSSICLTLPGFEMAVPMGVSSNGAVHSVYIGIYEEHEPLLEVLNKKVQLFSEIFADAKSQYDGDARQTVNKAWDELKGLDNFPLQQCPTLQFSKSSATSVMLSKIIYNVWFGTRAYNDMLTRRFHRSTKDQRPMELVIGDEALQRASGFYKTIDLGTIWKQMTGLPFVFAVWQSRGVFINGWRRRILEIGERAENRMKVEPANYFPSLLPQDEKGEEIKLADYWKSIQYKLGPMELRGLLAFLCLARKLQESPLDNSALVKILRWQELSNTSMPYTL